PRWRSWGKHARSCRSSAAGRHLTRGLEEVTYLQLAHNERHLETGTPRAKVIHSFGRGYLTKGGGHFIHAEKLRHTNREATAALARPGRYKSVAGNLRV